MFQNIAVAALATAGLVLTGCGSGNDEASKPATTPPSSSTIATPAPTEGCATEQTDELYVTELYDCTSRATKVYKFNTSTARDSYRKVAEEFGSVVVGQGDTWLEVKAA